MGKIYTYPILPAPSGSFWVRPPGNSFWKREIRIRNGFGLAKRKAFYDQLASLLHAGLSISGALEVVCNPQESRRFSETGRELIAHLNHGLPLSEAMSHRNHEFSSFEIQTIRMGESTGRLSAVFTELSRYYGGSLALNRKMVQVMSYPLVVILIAGLVLAFMLGRVIPMFEDIFIQSGARLPYVTRCVIGMSHFLRQWGIYFIMLITGLVILSYRYRDHNRIRAFSSRIILALPIAGPLCLKIHLARLCLSLSALLKSGIPLEKALLFTQNTTRFYPLQSSLPQIRDRLIAGNSLESAISEFHIYPFAFRQMVKAGERSASLDTMFERLGQNLEQESEASIGILMSLLEPLLIVFLALVVGGILISMYLPMFQMSQL